MPRIPDKEREDLLTKGERNKLERVSKIIESVCRDAVETENDDGNKVVIMTPELHGKVMTAIKAHQISTRSLLKICDKVQTGDWWSTSLRIINIVPPFDPPFYPALETKAGRKAIRPDEYPDYFSADRDDHKAKRLALGLPITCKYVSPDDLTMIQSLIKMLSDIQPDTAPDTQIIIPSTPANDAFSMGREALSTMRDDDQGHGLYVIENGNLTVAVSKARFDDGRIVFTNPNADKMFIQILEKAAASGFSSKTIELTLDEVMKARGLSDDKEARKSMIAAVDTMDEVSVKFTDVKTGKTLKFRLFQEAEYDPGRGLKKGVVRYVMGDRFFAHLKTTSSYVTYPRDLLKISNKYRNDFFVEKKFLDHARISAGKPNQDCLRVTSLLKVCQLPLPDDIPASAIATRIIKPFCDILERISASGPFDCTIYKSGKVRLNDEELERMNTDFEFFKTLVVYIEWKPGQRPDYSDVIEKKQRRIANAKKRGKRRTTTTE